MRIAVTTNPPYQEGSGERNWEIISQFLRKELDSRDDALDWMIKNQLGRRNLTSEQISYLRGKQHQREKKTRGGDRNSKGDNPPLNLQGTTAEKLAKE